MTFGNMRKVKFPLKVNLSLEIPQIADKNVFVVIWTTTPWTIPANLAITLNPEFEYVAVDTGNDNVYILARELVQSCMQAFRITDYSILAAIKPQTLEHKQCRHPLYKRQSLIILGHHVTLEAGTGCVHTAPGHGREDYDVGLLYGLDAYSPVDDRGCFTQDVDFFEGQFVFKADPAIIDRLREVNAIVAEDTIKHSYPHCWRCKKPVIFRATPQWFISMEKTGLREKALSQIDQVKWIPQWGKARIRGMLENRPDWCVSRQRAWGVPITVFYCEKCEMILMNNKIMDKVHALIEKHGADIWFEKDVNEFIPANTLCDKCGHNVFIKETDILDVWFDSGVSHAAVLEERSDLTWPADLYLEGSDQHRGWFHSSLLTAVGIKAKAPYKSVLTHGFVVDAKGRKMSKSIGNVVAPKKVINRYGAEVLRLWAAASDYKDDIRISENILKQLSDAYRRIRNTNRFLLGNLYDFDPAKDAVNYTDMLEIDRFALHRLQELIEKILSAYDTFDFHVIYHAIYNYCTIDLSAFYLDILKDRLYTALPESAERRSAQTVIYFLLDSIARLMAPILSFTAEEIWNFMPEHKARGASIHLAGMPAINLAWKDNDLAEKWKNILRIRQDVTKALEQARAEKIIGHSLDALVIICADEDEYNALYPYINDLKTIFIVSSVLLKKEKKPVGAYENTEIKGLSILVEPANGEKCERCWMHDPSVGKSSQWPGACKRCQGALEALDPK